MALKVQDQAWLGTGKKLIPRPSIRLMRNALATVCLLAGAACTTRGKDGAVSRHYFGYAVVTIPAAQPDGQRITVREIKSYGMATGGGGTLLGVGREKHVALPPDGRLYLVVQTDEQLEKALQLIENHPELGLCVTKNTNP